MDQTSQSFNDVPIYFNSGLFAGEMEDDMRRRIQEREEKAAQEKAEKEQREAYAQQQAELERIREKLSQP